MWQGREGYEQETMLHRKYFIVETSDEAWFILRIHNMTFVWRLKKTLVWTSLVGNLAGWLTILYESLHMHNFLYPFYNEVDLHNSFVRWKGDITLFDGDILLKKRISQHHWEGNKRFHLESHSGVLLRR